MSALANLMDSLNGNIKSMNNIKSISVLSNTLTYYDVNNENYKYLDSLIKDLSEELRKDLFYEIDLKGEFIINIDGLGFIEDNLNDFITTLEIYLMGIKKGLSI